MRIVVFGAGGFVGGWICEQLSLLENVEQVACVRKWSSCVRLARRGIEIKLADLARPQELPSLLAGADAVINAAMLPPSCEPDLVIGLHAACEAAGVRRLVQLSSAALYGNRAGIIDESTVPAPVDAYGRGKAEMERRLARASNASKIQVVILRPSIVYGPFSEGWTIRYARRIETGRWKSLGPIGEGICNLIHAQDVAKSAIAAATTNLGPGTHILNLNGPDRVTWNQYIEQLGDELGTPKRKRQNALYLRAMAAVAAILSKAGGVATLRSFYKRSQGTVRSAFATAKGVTDLYPKSSEIQLLGRKAVYVAEKAEALLGKAPSVPLDQGIRQSVAWCRLHGIV